MLRKEEESSICHTWGSDFQDRLGFGRGRVKWIKWEEKESGLKEFDSGHSYSLLVDWVALFLDVILQFESLFCTPIPLRCHRIIVMLAPCLHPWVGPVLCLCSGLQLTFRSQKSPWWLEVQTANSRYIFFQGRQQLTLPATTVILEQECKGPIVSAKPTYTHASLCG